MIQKLKNNWLLISLLLVTFISRIYLLDRLPSGISNDELHFVLNSKSVFYRFTDLANSGWNPLSLKTIPHETSSELTFIVLAPILGLLPTNLFTARLPLAIFGTIFVYFIYLLSLRLFNKKIALISAIVAILNPWSFYVFRTSFDAPIALTFFLWGIYLIIRYPNYRSLFSLIPLTFAFYTYIGTKLIFLPIIITTLVFVYFQNKLKLKYILTILVFSIFIIGIYSYQILNSHEVRLSEIVTPFSPVITDQVILSRQQSLISPLSIIINNKITVYFKFVTAKYLTNFSPDLFFLTGDHTYMVSLWQHGYFYYLDFLVILLGFGYLFAHHRNKLFFIATLIALSPLPEALRADTIPAYAFHSCFQYPFLYILLASGIYFISTLKFSQVLLSFFVIIQFLECINFLDIYFYRYPIYQPESFTFSRQVLANYLIRNTSTIPAFIISKDPESLYRNYIFYNNSLTNLTIDQIQSDYPGFQKNKLYKIQNLTFTDQIDKVNPTTDSFVIMEKSLSQRGPIEPNLFINLLNTTDPLYTIANDNYCQPSTKKAFYSLKNIHLSSLSPEDFCNLYIYSAAK